MILAAVSHLVFSVVVSRHGVRSITSTPPVYSWADWTPVKPGNLTRHGYDLVTYLGQYYKANDAQIDCAKRNVFVYADIDQRTLETARAYVAGMCGTPEAIPVYHDVEAGIGTNDPIFDAQDWMASQGLASPIESEKAVRAVAGSPLTALVVTHRDDFNQFAALLNARCPNACLPVTTQPSRIEAKNGLSELTGPVKSASNYAEDVFLEVAECRQLSALSNLEGAMRLHVLAYDINSRNAYNSAVRGSNLYAHIIGLLEEKAGFAHPGVEVPDVRNDAVALISGHDTELGALGGILNAHWALANGLVPDDMPPGGALVFDLYKKGAEYSVKLVFVYETMAQFTSNKKLARGVAVATVTCGVTAAQGCEMPLGSYAAIGNLRLVQPAWTEMTSAPVALEPLADPEWSRCR